MKKTTILAAVLTVFFASQAMAAPQYPSLTTAEPEFRPDMYLSSTSDEMRKAYRRWKRETDAGRRMPIRSKRNTGNGRRIALTEALPEKNTAVNGVKSRKKIIRNPTSDGKRGIPRAKRPIRTGKRNGIPFGNRKILKSGGKSTAGTGKTGVTTPTETVYSRIRKAAMVTEAEAAAPNDNVCF